MALTSGARLGHYEILAAIDAGGMGEVYRARDPRLDREVAIKVLAGRLAADAEALSRFEREAMTVAKLSHPNILAIHEFGRDGATAYVVMELVSGRTLHSCLAAGGLPPRRAVDYALQIARGLGAAHVRGVVHRDLKPANVMISRDDQVKILDFGLAKSMDPIGTELTAPGLTTTVSPVAGTVGYMAPEQIRGLTVDHRADIFAFGAVLYEMLCGQRAFTGETAADSATATLTKDPPELDLVRLAVPVALDRIVRRCLEKSPDSRFQSASDLAFALETFSSVPIRASTTVAETAPRRTVTAVWLPWIVAGIAVLAAAAAWIPRTTPENADARFDHFTRVSEAAGEETSPSISPDGTTVAYSIWVNGSWDIYAQRVGGRNTTPIVNDPQRDERGVAFAPDGSLIAFHESDDLGGIFVAGATGESVRRLTDFGFDPAWSPDRKQIAFATEEIVDPATRLGDSTLYVVDAAGGAPRKVVDGDAVQPSWSPDGQRLVYWSNTGGQRDIYTVAAVGGARVAVTRDSAIDWSPVWSPDGRFIYFSSDRGGAMTLWRIEVDQRTGQAQRPPEAVMAAVQASAALPRFSKDGSRLSFQSSVTAINLAAIPFDPSTMRAGVPILLETENNVRIPSDVSPDGKLIALYSLGDQQEDVFIRSADGMTRRITDDMPLDRAPVFTPDGRSLVFYSNRDGNWGLWMVALDGGNLRKIAGEGPGAAYVNLSPKGDTVIFVAASGRTVFSAPLGGGSPTPLRGTHTGDKYFTPTAWSPDGARLAGPVVSESGRSAGIAIYELAQQATRVVSGDEAFGVKFLADSRRIVYFTKNGRELVVLDTVSLNRSAVDVRLPAPASTNGMFAMSRDNRTIYYGAVRKEADIWIVERSDRLQR
jgi:Tol biopolymer transport system component/serine/threonine protein kinase